jgi:uridine kinase
MKPTIIIIAGPAASGKTSLISWLTQRYPDIISVIPMDNYYYSLDHMPEKERHFVNYDHPDSIEWSLLEKHLIQLANGKSILCPNYSYVKQTRVLPLIPVEPRPVILLDGLLSLSMPNIRKHADSAIYIDTPIDICLARKIKRDIEKRGRTLAQSTRQYLTMTRPMYYEYVLPSRQFADFILPCSERAHKQCAILEKYLQLSAMDRA